MRMQTGAVTFWTGENQNIYVPLGFEIMYDTDRINYW